MKGKKHSDRTRSVSWLQTNTFALVPAIQPWLSRFCNKEMPVVRNEFIIAVV